MDNDFKEFAAKRCEKAIEEDVDYMDDEISGTLDQEELQARAEILCYFQGMRDMAKLMGINIPDSSILSMIGSHGSQGR